MNALLVLNIGGTYVQAAARESLQAAAARWGVEYREITEPVAKTAEGRPLHPFWQKTFIAETAAAPYERVAVLDGDMLIRDDCPSLFAIVPRGTIGVCSRQQMGFPQKDDNQKLKFWAYRLALKCPWPRYHLNGGLLVYEPVTHAEVLRQWQEAGRKISWRIGLGENDQGALSVILHNNPQVPVMWLPWQFNACHALTAPRTHAPAGVMRAFIYHFNGPGNKAARMARCQWRSAPPA